LKSIKKKTIKAFSWDFIGRFFSQSSTFVVSIFLARLLNPEDFGLIAMAMAFIHIGGVFIDVGFSAALIQNKENSTLTYNTIFIFNIIAGICLTGLVYFMSDLIGEFYNNPEIALLVKWLSLFFVFNSFNRVQNAILSRELNFKALTIRMFIASTIGGSLGVAAAYNDYGVYSLVIQILSTAVMSTLLLWSTSKWRPKLQFSYQEMKKLFGFSVFAFLERVMNNIFLRLDVLLLAKIFNPIAVGFYTRASTLQDQATKYSSSSIIRVLFPVLSKYQDRPNEFRRIYLKMFEIISFLSFGLTGLLFILGSDIIISLFGEKWAPSIPIFQILILASATIPLNSLMWNAIMSQGKSKENFYLGLVKKTISLIPFVIAIKYNILYFTVTWVIAKYIATSLNMFLIYKISAVSIRGQMISVFKTSIPLVLGIVVFYISDLQNIGTRIASALLFSVLYLVFAALMKNQGFIYIQSTIKEIKNSLNKNKALE
jgi:O-antigen/teichoic acid export membrane protein